MDPKRQRSRTTGGKKDISLMTILAHEATSDSRKILKKYGKPDASSCQDLEVKLAELYYGTPDKIALEKELAAIHPHKNWILKYYPQTPVEQAKEDIKQIEEGKDEVLSNASGCGCSSFDGKLGAVENTPTVTKNLSTIDYMGMIGMFAVIGLTFYVITKR